MLNISGFLEKFKKFDKNKSQQKDVIVSGIQKVVGVSIDPRNFEIRSGILYVKSSPMVKQEIFMKKEQILPLIVSEGIFDIR